MFSTTTVADGLTNFRAETNKEIAGASRFFSKPKGKDDMKKKKKFGRGEPKHVDDGQNQNFAASYAIKITLLKIV